MWRAWQVCGSETKSSSLSSLYFRSCSRQIASPAQKYGCFAVNWFREIKNLRTTWFADWIGINDFLKISTLANWATQKDLWPHILSVLSGCLPKKKANKSWYRTSDGAAIISFKCMYMTCNLHTITSVNLTWLKFFIDEAAVTVF